MTDVRKSKRGPKPLGQAKRGHSVSVRFNDDEIKAVDARRGRLQRGRWIRALVLAGDGGGPAAIPAINAKAYAELAHAQANLNQLAHRANAGDLPEFHEISEVLSAFRLGLLGIK